MIRYLSRLLPGICILFVLVSAGCTGTLPAEKSTAQPTPLPTVDLPATNAPAATATIQTVLQPETTITASPSQTPVATLTTKPIPPPTTSSIYIEGVRAYVYPLSFDSTGFPTKGNITVSGVIESLSSYPLKVVMRAQIYDPVFPAVPKATAYETITITPHGLSGFNLEMNDFEFNTRPNYATLLDTYNLTVMNVSVAPG